MGGPCGKHIQIGTAAGVLISCFLVWSLIDLRPQSTFLLLLLSRSMPCNPLPCLNSSDTSRRDMVQLATGNLERFHRGPTQDGQSPASSQENCANQKPVESGCVCSRDAMISGSALEGLAVGQRKCLAVNLDAETGGRLNMTRQWRDNLRLWEEDSKRLGVLAIVRGPASARLVTLTDRGHMCFTGDVVVPSKGEYAIEVLARLEEVWLRNQGLLLADPIPVMAVGSVEGQEVVETYDPGSKACATFSDVNGKIIDPLANGHGFWVPCSAAPYLPNCNAVLEDGWTFVQPDCHYPLTDHETALAKLAAFEETAPPQALTKRKKLGVLILGDSRSRGLFLELASRVLDPETAANLTLSEYFKVWGIIHFETPTISLTWRDMRAYSAPCPDFAEAYVWPEGVTLGFERIKKCRARQADVLEDLARLVATVKPDLVYAQHGFVPLDQILVNSPQVVRVALLGWAQLSKALGMVSDVTDWDRSSGKWYRFNTLEVELPMYREVCNEHEKSSLDIHMHTVCGANGEKLCGLVNQMTVQIMLHDIFERLPYIAYIRRNVPNVEASWTLQGSHGALRWAEIPDGWPATIAAQSAQLEAPGALDRSALLYACRGGADNFEPDYVMGLLEKLECKREVIKVPGFRDTHQKCSNYTILDKMATTEPHKWLWQFTKLDDRYRREPSSILEDDW